MSTFSDVTLEQLDQSKIFVNPKTPMFRFDHPMQYAGKFIRATEGLGAELLIRTEVDAMNAENNEEQTVNTSYSTVLFRAKLPQIYDLNVEGTLFNHLWSEIGFLISFAGTNPEIRTYTGKRVSICDNGCIFGANQIKTVRMASLSNGEIDEAVDKFVNESATQNERYSRIIEQMKSKVFTERDGSINEKLGEIVRTCLANPRLGVQLATNTIKSLEDTKSRYSIQSGEIDGWKLYNALTEECKRSSIKDEAARVGLLEKLGLYDLKLN